MKTKRNISIFILAILVASFSMTVLAAGKTVSGYKLNTYTTQKGSDANTLVQGVYDYVSGYTKTYKEGTSVVSSDFTKKDTTIKYWSSHGNSSGDVWGDWSNATATMSSTTKFSGSNLEFLFLASCHQLNSGGSNPRSWYANSMVGTNAVRVICGYHEGAPAAMDNNTAKEFLVVAKTGESVKSSWIKANENTYDTYQYSNNRYYLVLTHSGNVQYSRFEGFSTTTYTRPGSSSTSILRFSSANPGGVNQPYSVVVPMSELMSINSETSSFSRNTNTLAVLDAPGYTITLEPVAEPRGLDAKGEIGHERVSLTENDAVRLSANRIGSITDGMALDSLSDSTKLFADNYGFKQGMATEVYPIVMAEVLEDSSKEVEIPVAYTVRQYNTFNGIKIAGDVYTTIIDDEGVKYSYFNWHRVTAASLDTSAAKSTVNFTDAVSQAKGYLSTHNGICDCQNEIHVELQFVQDGSSNVYKPTWVFTSSGQKILVDCLTSTVTVDYE